MLPEGTLPNLMLLAGLGLMAAILMRRIYRRKRRGNRKQPSQSVTNARSQPLLDAPQEITRWQVEMHEVARELRAELDTKAVMVQTLVGMLREEIDRLQQVLAKSKAAGIEPLDSDLLAEIKRLSAEIDSSSAESIRKADLATDELKQVADPEAAGPQTSPRQARICVLADQGMLPDEIARLLAIPLAEVELVISTRAK